MYELLTPSRRRQTGRSAYDGHDHGFENERFSYDRVPLRAGLAGRLAGLGQSPIPPALLEQARALLDVAVETDDGGLRRIKPSYRAQVIQALEGLEYLDVPGQDPLTRSGSAAVGRSSPWVTEFLQQGYAVLMDPDLGRGVVAVVMTKRPEAVAHLATEGGHVLVDGPTALVKQAWEVLRPPAPLPACPGGQAYAPALQKCVDIQGGVVDRAPASSAGLLVGLAVAVTAVVGLVVVSRKR